MLRAIAGAVARTRAAGMHTVTLPIRNISTSLPCLGLEEFYTPKLKEGQVAQKAGRLNIGWLWHAVHEVPHTLCRSFMDRC
jgi:hypothetical protein